MVKDNKIFDKFFIKFNEKETFYEKTEIYKINKQRQLTGWN